MDRYLRVKTNIFVSAGVFITQEIIPLENIQHIAQGSAFPEIDVDYFQQHSGGHPHVRFEVTGTGGVADLLKIIQALQDIAATKDKNPIGIFDVDTIVPGAEINVWDIQF